MSQFVPLAKKERDEMYSDLTGFERPLQLKINGQKIKQGKIYLRKPGRIYFRLNYLDRFEGTHDAVLTFSLPPVVYFLKTEVCAHEGKFYFLESEEVFRLQRRESFRVNIPPSTSSKVSIDGREFRIHDVSYGGFSVEVAPQESKYFLAGKIVAADLQLMGETIHTTCETRQSRLVPTSKDKFLYGFQFQKLKASEEEKLFHIIMTLARK